MAFVRTKSINGHEYNYLVRSVREGGKVKQETLAYLGKYGSLQQALDVLRPRLTFFRGREAKCIEMLGQMRGGRNRTLQRKLKYWQEHTARLAERVAQLEGATCSAEERPPAARG